jgi:RNA polymerase sigma-70 factor (ECF subfamily)
MSKTSESPTATFEDVMAQADWVRRFAVGLCRDVDTAADVAWEGLTRAWQHPPDRRGPLRPWLATVVRNLVSSEARASVRRLARHQALGEISPAAAESAEDQLARWELFKDLVALVEALDEPFRQTVQGRYFDGLSSADIARRDGIPEATVRGRLKTGLDRLRAQLDERHEGRSRWVALLIPLVPKAAALRPGGRSHLPRSGLWLASGLLVVAGICFWKWPGFPTRKGWRLMAAASAGAGAPLPAGRGSTTSERPLASAEGGSGPKREDGLPACLGDLSELREKRRVLEQQMARSGSAHGLYRLARKTNDRATAELKPLVAPIMHDRAGHLVPFELTCHELVCRLESFWSSGDGEATIRDHLRDNDLLLRVGWWEMSNAPPTRDTLTREPLTRWLVYLGLRRQDAAPGASAILRLSEWIPTRTEPTLPVDSAGCRAERDELAQTLTEGRQMMEAERDPAHLAPGASPNPELAARLTPILRAVLLRTWGATELTVACQGTDCRIDVPAAFAQAHPDWMTEIFPVPALEDAMAFSAYTSGNAFGFLRMIPPGFQSGTRWLIDLVDRRMALEERTRAIAGCRPGGNLSGTVGVELEVTTARLPDDSDDDAPIHFSQTGSLAGTSAGDCVMAVYRQLIGEVEVPATLWEGSASFEHEWKD